MQRSSRIATVRPTRVLLLPDSRAHRASISSAKGEGSTILALVLVVPFQPSPSDGPRSPSRPLPRPPHPPPRRTPRPGAPSNLAGAGPPPVRRRARRTAPALGRRALRHHRHGDRREQQSADDGPLSRRRRQCGSRVGVGFRLGRRVRCAGASHANFCHHDRCDLHQR
jgi:hypothetical protein